MERQERPLAKITVKKFNSLRKTHGSDKKIAELYGVTRQAIFQLRKKLNIPPTRTPDSLLKRNIKLYRHLRCGVPVATVARIYNMTKIYVYSLKRKLKKRVK